MKLAPLFFSFACALEWENCGSESDMFSLDKLLVIPDKIARGEKFTLNLTGNLKQEILQGSSVTLNVKLGNLTLFQERKDLCQELSKIDDVPHCPLKPGLVEISKEIDVPRNIPKGKYTVTVKASSDMNERIACIKMILEIQ